MQVTAIYQGSEIGHGQGDGYVYAVEECIDSIDAMYIENALEDIELIFNDVGGSGLPKYALLTDFFYLTKQYF